MTLKSLAVRTGIATVALTALGLAAASPASAHTNNMYTYVDYDDQIQQAGFVTYSKIDGTTAYLPTTFVPEETRVRGIEVANEKGTEIVDRDGFQVRTWDHTTGDAGDYVPLVLPVGSDLDTVLGLDTLNDGTTVTLVSFEIDFAEGPIEFWAIASVDSTSGTLTPLVDITAAIFDEESDEFLYNPQSLATDPATGITYVFLQGDNDHELFFLPVTVATETVGDVTLFEDPYLEHGGLFGADFDAGDGNLYIHFDDHDSEELQLQLLRLGAPATWATAAPTYISTAPAESDTRSIAPLALTIEHTTLANTGSELPVLAIVLVGTVAVLAGGVTVMVARRRSEAGTV